MKEIEIDLKNLDELDLERVVKAMDILNMKGAISDYAIVKKELHIELY